MPTSNSTQIYYFRGDHAFLSNFHIVPGGITYEGIKYWTVEAAYQAQKTLEHKFRVAISQMSTATTAKRAGRDLVLRPDWEDVKVGVMLELLMLKFADTPDTESLRYLLADTVGKELIEGNSWDDTFWGKCNCLRTTGTGPHKDIRLPGPKEYARETGDVDLVGWMFDGTGENTLGTLLTAVRETL